MRPGQGGAHTADLSGPTAVGNPRLPESRFRRGNRGASRSGVCPGRGLKLTRWSLVGAESHAMSRLRVARQSRSLSISVDHGVCTRAHAEGEAFDRSTSGAFFAERKIDKANCPERRKPWNQLERSLDVAYQRQHCRPLVLGAAPHPFEKGSKVV